MTEQATNYAFDNAARQAEQRFGSLAALYDPNTIRRFEAVEIGEGWRCLEVGGGGGSIAGWLARRVGSTGQVVVTDIDPRHLTALASLDLANVEVRRHDIGRDPLTEGAFNLVHERLVLIHVPTRREALRKMATALKPGGWLVAEDFDPPFADETWITEDETIAALYRKMFNALRQVLVAHGAEYGWGRRLYQELQANGLVDVGMEAYLTVFPSGSTGTRLYQANFEQVRAEAVQAGLITDRELDELLARMDHPTAAVGSPVMFTAWGRRPA